jgi:formate dehydrogenase major subunit
MAECHPVGFQWVMEAKARGATIIHVDPRYTRTSAVSDIHAPIRAGADIAFLGGIINYVLSRGLDFREYLLAFSNAAELVGEDFVDAEDLDGLFSGYDEQKRTYDPSSWAMQAAGGGERSDTHGTESQKTGGEAPPPGANGEVEPPHAPVRDETLQDPRCVYQVLKRHYARYTPEMVAEVSGCPKELFERVCETVTKNSGRERTTAWVYSVGWTHHSVAVQYIRSAAILQLLLGNIGRPGGGILALRGHASIQGSTDIPTLFNLLPGYLPMPAAAQPDGLDAYVEHIIGDGQKSFWSDSRAYIVSMLKSWYGDAATPENEFGFRWLPRINDDHGTYTTALDMLAGKIPGYFVVGENPAVGSAHGKLQRLAMAKLDFLVVRDLTMIDTASFWKDSPEIETGELRTEDIGTEVFFFPAAAHTEKEGSFTNTQRLLQWRHKAVEAPGDCRSDLHFFFHLGRIMRARLAGSTDPRDAGLLNLTWDYSTEGELAEPDGEEVLQEINGSGPDGPLSAYLDLKDDGSTSCGCWIYCGVGANGINQAARRKPGSEQSWVAPEWGWAWPANRRTLYNRASADLDGKPWSTRKAYVWWDAEAKKWTGHDVPDMQPTKDPHHRAPADAKGTDALNGNDAFIMQPDGRAWLYAASGLVDGPMPTHYEPHESPVRNALYGQQANPTRQVYEDDINPSNPSPPEYGSDVYPCVFTTYRLTEHHTAGGMSRTLPYLAELQPEMFIEISPELAAERGVEHGGWCHVVTARSAIEGRAVVTERVAPLTMGDRIVHQVGIPYHWGGNGLTTGDSANDLFGLALDRNVHIQESKVASCDVVAGRRPRGPELLTYVAGFRERARVTTATGNTALTTTVRGRGASSSPSDGTEDGTS